MPQVESSALTVHGGRVDAAALRFPDASRPWLDLSTGINPLAYPVPSSAGTDWFALPGRARLAELEAAAALAFGMRTGCVAALPGSEMGLRMLDALGLPEPFGVRTPTYGTHHAALPDATRLAADDLATTACATVLLANPNNPDGKVVRPDALLAAGRARGGWTVVDEAFADAMPDVSVLPRLGDTDRVLVFRSFGKFYGLAGVRLGFACGPAAIVDTIRARLGDWPVSSAAIETGIAAYRDAAWQDATRAWLGRGRDALDAVLRRNGLEPRGDCPLFRLVETETAGAVFERLGRAGILVRPFDYAPHWLRFGLPGDAAALDRLDRALGGVTGDG